MKRVLYIFRIALPMLLLIALLALWARSYSTCDVVSLTVKPPPGQTYGPFHSLTSYRGRLIYSWLESAEPAGIRFDSKSLGKNKIVFDLVPTRNLAGFQYFIHPGRPVSSGFFAVPLWPIAILLAVWSLHPWRWWRKRGNDSSATESVP